MYLLPHSLGIQPQVQIIRPTMYINREIMQGQVSQNWHSDTKVFCDCGLAGGKSPGFA